MKRNFNTAFLALNCLFSILPSSHALPLKRESSSVQVSGSVDKVVTSAVESRNPEPLKTRYNSPRTYSKRDTTWTVESGDTGNGIAERLNIPFTQLALLNPSVNWNNLQIGQLLTIPFTADTTASLKNTTSTLLNTTLTNSTLNTVIVKSGDTFTSIAAAYGISIQSIATANPGADSWNLKIGQVLNLPANANTKALSTGQLYSNGTLPVTSTASTLPGTPISPTSAQTYVVKAGDMGWTIANTYGISFSDLSAVNPGVVWTDLQIGQVLNLPTSTLTSTNATSSPGSLVSRKAGTDTYMTYTGSVATSFYPLMSSWESFENLWTANQNYIGTNCAFSAGSVTPNTAAENADLKTGILAVAGATGVNPSFIFALVMQESNGCVRVPTTFSWQGIANPGLTQSYNGIGSCNSNGNISTPCPLIEIEQMLWDGIAGSKGVGILPALKQAATDMGVVWNPSSSSTTANATATSAAAVKANAIVDANVDATVPIQRNIVEETSQTGHLKRASTVDQGELYYMAARIYNSGSIPVDGDLSGATGSTQCYVSDIVNRLMGWVAAPNTCTLS